MGRARGQESGVGARSSTEAALKALEKDLRASLERFVAANGLGALRNATADAAVVSVALVGDLAFILHCEPVRFLKKLSPKERTVALMGRAGLRAKEIAKRTELTVNTVYTYQRRIRSKVGRDHEQELSCRVLPVSSLDLPSRTTGKRAREQNPPS